MLPGMTRIDHQHRRAYPGVLGTAVENRASRATFRFPAQRALTAGGIVTGDVVWANPFPGGIADASGRRALWRDSSGRTLALDLANGDVTWRSDERLVPLLLNEGVALCLAFGPPRVVALPLSPDAHEAWRSDVLPWPQWALELSAPNPGVQVRAGWMGLVALVHWRLDKLSQSGIVQAGQQRTETTVGACTLDPSSGNSSPLTNWPEPPDAEGLALASRDPQVMGQANVAGVHYLVSREPSNSQTKVILRARDAARGQALWERELEEFSARPPRPLRP